MIIPKHSFHANFHVKIACAIFFMLVLLTTSQAYTDLEIDNARCVGNGKFTLGVLNRFSDPVILEDTEITLAHSALGTFPVQGSWDKESVFPGTTRSQVATFTSTTGNVNRSGSYTGVISFAGCKYPPCQEIFGFDKCPEFKYNCEMNKLVIDQCTVRENEVWVKFSGLNKGQHEHLEPLRDLLISVKSNARTVIKTTYFNNTQFIQHGADNYILKIPRYSNERFYSIQLHINKCKNDVDPTPVMCVINLEPLVERKLNESMSQENATVAPPNQTQQEETRQNQSRRGQSTASRSQETTRADAEQPATSPAAETPEANLSAQEQGVLSTEQKISDSAKLFMMVIGMLWLLGLIVVLVLLTTRSP